MKLNLLSRRKKALHARRGIFQPSSIRTRGRKRQALCEPLEVRNLLSANPISRHAFMVAGDATPVQVGADLGALAGSHATAIGGQLDPAEGEIARIRLEITDLNGDPIDFVPLGESFLLRGLTSDLRDEPQGVFVAFVDVAYNTGLASVSSAITPGPSYTVGATGDASTDGLIDEVGGVGNFSTPRPPGELLLFSVEFTADAEGTLTFTPDPADGLGNDVAVLGINEALLDSDVELLGASILVGTPTILSVSDPTAIEGDSGEMSLEFVVTLSEASDETVTVDVMTADGTATLETDYLANMDPLTFEPGVTSQTVIVRILGDTLDEDDETVLLNLSNPMGAIIGDGQGVGTITDDDDPPTVSINNVTMAEGTGATPTEFVFTVSLSAASGREVTVDFATVGDSAVAPGDYAENSGTLTFMPGETEQTITVEVVADDMEELNEQFFVSLTGATNATIDDELGVGTITDDDTVLPTLEIDSIDVDEDDGTATFTVRVVGASNREIMVNFATANGTAVAGQDYLAISDTLTIPAGMTSGTISVMLTDDARDEDPETFVVNLSAPVNATLADTQATATINDNDPEPTLTFVDDIELDEGDSGITNFDFVVALSEVSGKRVTFQFQVTGITATAGQDFNVPTTLTGAIEAGQTQTTIRIPVIGDMVVESNEIFDVMLTDPVNATIPGLGVAIGTIRNDDFGDPTVSINDIMVDEGDDGTTDAMFTVTLSRAAEGTVTVDFATMAGTATAGADFQATSGTVTFTTGQRTRTITIPVIGDLLREVDETFTVVLSNPDGAVLGDAEGVATILDDDVLPTLSINDVEVTEGDGNTVNALFTVTLSEASTQTVTVNFTAASGTATLGDDFRASTGTLTFAPGVLTRTVTVEVIGDFLVEEDETFFVNLTSPTNANLADAQGVGTIIDEDEPDEFMPSSISGVVWVDVNRDGQRSSTERGLAGVTIRLTGTDEFGNAVDETITTGADGRYSFANLVAGSYRIAETQPIEYNDGVDLVGSHGGTTSFDQFFLELGAGEDATDYNFGEEGLRIEFIGRHLFFVP